MWDVNTNTTSLPVLDRFHGDDALVRLSARLMEWDEAPVTDEEIAEALGEGVIEAFRYTQKKLAGRVRKVTGEPSLCHSADVAIRAVSLGYSEDIAKACLLHDVAEDTASSFAQLPEAFGEIAERFSTVLAQDVALLTNRHQLLFQATATKVRPTIEPTRRGVDAFRAALDVVYHESSPKLCRIFNREFVEVSTFLESDIDLTEAANQHRRNRKFSFAKFIERKLYGLYIRDMSRNAVTRVGVGMLPTPLIVKSVDITDNVRTSEISNRSTLNRLLRKAETIIDVIQSAFLDQVPVDAATRSTIAPLHRTVQIRFVDQIKLRRRALANNFSETRFASLIRFLVDEGNRLTGKYRIPVNRIEVVEELEAEVRRINSLTPKAPY
ncbi:MAG: HD domain-containing protein [Myxococcota bacterium]